MLAHIPLLLTLSTLVLVAGIALGGFAAMAGDPAPLVQNATISADGSTCAVFLRNPGNSEVQLSALVLSSGSGSAAVSFASSFSLRPNQTTVYGCSLGTPSQFVPTVSGQPGMRYNLTARFDGGSFVTYSSTFG